MAPDPNRFGIFDFRPTEELRPAKWGSTVVLRSSNSQRPMSALGQKQTSRHLQPMSALCQKQTYAAQQNTLFLVGKWGCAARAQPAIVKRECPLCAKSRH